MLSITSVISAAVVLTSRLRDDLTVIALMLFAVEAFVLFPILRRRLQVHSYPMSCCGRAYDEQSTPAPVQASGTLGLAALAGPLPGYCVAVLVSVTLGHPLF